MNTYLASIKATSIKMALVLVIFLITAVFIKQTNALGSLLLGGLGSFGYFFLLASRIYKAANMQPSTALRYMRTGSQLRLSYICAVLIIAFKIPDIRVLPFFLGLFTYQLVARFDGLYIIVQGYLKPIK